MPNTDGGGDPAVVAVIVIALGVGMLATELGQQVGEVFNGSPTQAPDFGPQPGFTSGGLPDPLIYNPGPTLGTAEPTIFTTPLENEPVTFGLDFQDFPLPNTNELPDMSVLQARVIQTGGNTLNEGTARRLNEYFGMDLPRRVWGRALEALKKATHKRNYNHGKILEDGTYTDRENNVIGNLLDYLP